MGNHGLTLEGTYYIVGGQELSLPSPFYLHFFLSVHHHLIMFVIVFWCWHNIEDSLKKMKVQNYLEPTYFAQTTIQSTNKKS